MHKALGQGAGVTQGAYAAHLAAIGLAFVLTYAMVMRAAFVPTSARHTTLLTLAVGAPLVPIGFLAGSAADGMGYHLFSSSSLATGAWHYDGGL